MSDPSPTASASLPASPPSVETTSSTGSEFKEPATPDKLSLRPQKPSPKPSTPASKVGDGSLPTSPTRLTSPASKLLAAAPFRGPRNDQRPNTRFDRNHPRDNRDNRDRRQGPRDNRDNRDFRDNRGNRDNRERRDNPRNEGKQHGGTRQQKQEANEDKNKNDDSKGDASYDGFKPVERKDGKPLHPLDHSWTFWFDRRPTNKARKSQKPDNYESNLKEVGTFNNVEYFWRYWHHMEKASNLEMNANYHLFKTGVKPLWEDDANKEGGKWIIKLSSRDRANIDTFWQNLVLGLIGEGFENSDDVCGAVLSRRKGGDRISVWNRNRNHAGAIMSLGKQIKQIVADGNALIEKDLQLAYSWHEDSIKTGAGFSNISRYSL